MLPALTELTLPEEAPPGSIASFVGRDISPRGQRLWAPLKYHPIQCALWETPARFVMVPAGRRSGKTLIAKRNGILRAATFPLSDGWFVFAAPVHKQAVNLYWNDLKAMVPRSWQLRKPSESDHIIYLLNGAEIQVVGLDVPERLEGRPLDGITLDEYGNCRGDMWDANIRPALSTPGRPPGWAWFIGVPEGRNHYYDMWQSVLSSPDDDEWAGFTWPSSDIMDPKEIESLRRKLDPRVYDQEINASFVSFDGNVYYNFVRNIHARVPLKYDPSKTLYLSFDFNVDPGTANMIQEAPPTLSSDGALDSLFGPIVTKVIDEVHQAGSSSTPKVCREIIDKYRRHLGHVVAIGDPSGGNRVTSQTIGTDIDIIKQHFKDAFGDRFTSGFSTNKVFVKPRLNAMNARFKTRDGLHHFQIDPIKCPHTCKDFEGVVTEKGTAGLPDKKKAEREGLGHHADGIGYYMHRKHPIRKSYLLMSSS